jgi:hypothetical protein
MFELGHKAGCGGIMVDGVDTGSESCAAKQGSVLNPFQKIKIVLDVVIFEIQPQNRSFDWYSFDICHYIYFFSSR